MLPALNVTLFTATQPVLSGHRQTTANYVINNVCLRFRLALVLFARCVFRDTRDCAEIVNDNGAIPRLLGSPGIRIMHNGHHN